MLSLPNIEQRIEAIYLEPIMFLDEIYAMHHRLCISEDCQKSKYRRPKLLQELKNKKWRWNVKDIFWNFFENFQKLSKLSFSVLDISDSGCGHHIYTGRVCFFQVLCRILAMELNPNSVFSFFAILLRCFTYSFEVFCVTWNWKVR